MNLNPSTRRQKSGFIVIILAIIVVIIAYTLVWLIARKLTQIIPNGKTNTVQYYYQTNYGYPQNLPGLKLDSPFVEGASTTNVLPVSAFTFLYGFHAGHGWVNFNTNLTVTVPGTVCELENDSIRYVVAFNTGTNSLTMAYDANTGTELYEVTNQPVTVTICKSTNLVDWEPLWTDTNLVPDTVQIFTDSNASEPEAFYKVR